MKMTMALDKQQLFSIEQPGKMKLKCLSGHLWVTTGEENTDITLREGEKTTINSNHKLVIQGIINSKIALQG